MIVFGLQDYRQGQQEIIEHIYAKKDALVLMPTGGGKSLCYQLPAVASKGLTIVISPLLALIQNQVDGLVALGIKAASFNSSLKQSEKKEASFFLMSFLFFS